MENLKIKIGNTELEILTIKSIPYGRGNKKIFVNIQYRNHYECFTSFTNDMKAWKKANAILGLKNTEETFKLIENKIIDEVCEWIIRTELRIFKKIIH